MAHTHLEQIVTAAGLTADAVKAIVDLPADAKDFTPDAHVTALRENVATAVKNDPKFYDDLTLDKLPKEVAKALEQAQYGRAATIVRTNILKAAGLKEEDFKDLGDDGKKLEVFTPAFMKKVTEGKVTDKELQAAVQAANTELEALKAQMPELENRYKGEYEKKVEAYEVKTGVLSAIAATPGLKVSPKLVLSDTLERLRGQYHLALVNGEVVVRQKDKPDLKVLVDGNTRELTLARAVTELLTTEGAIDADAAKKKVDRTTGKVIVEPDKKGGFQLGHTQSKIQQRMDKEAKANGQA